MTETYTLSPVQRRIWDAALGRDAGREACAAYAVTGAEDRAIRTALESLAQRWEILRTTYPTPPTLAVPIQAVGSQPAWSVSVEAGLVQVRLPALSMDRRGFDLLGDALADALQGCPVPDAPQYPDIAGWLDELSTDPAGEPGRAFWAQQAADPGSAAPVPIPPAHCADAQGPTSGVVPHGLEHLARRHGVSTETALLGAWHLLLQRLAGERSSRVAVAADGRTQPALRHALGPLARWLPGAWRADPARPLPASWPDLAAAAAERLSWQDCTEGGGAAFGFRAEPAPGERRRVRLVSLDLPEEKHALRLVCSTDTLRIEGDGGAYVLRALLALLEGLVSAPDTPAGRLPVMPPALRRRLVADFNATGRTFPDTDAVGLFEAACDHAPSRPALRHDGTLLSYAQLDAAANAIARRLAEHRIGPECRVGLLAPRSPALAAGLLGILKAGAVFVPLDPADPPARRDLIAADAALALVLHTPGQPPPAGIAALLLDGAQGAVRPGRHRHPDSLAYVLHTSGSTGRPKGVAITHRGLANYLAWAGEAYRPEQGRGVPVHTSAAFDLTLTALLLPLTRGQFIDLLPMEAPVAALAAGLANGADWSLVKLTPSHLKALGADASVAGGARRLVIGGEALFGEQLAAWTMHDPQIAVVNEYGPTETVVGCCIFESPAGRLPPGPIPIGAPIANMTILVLDANGEPVPPGVAGEGWIGGVGLARGYLGRPDLTADKFRPDPAGAPGGRAYRSGDRLRHRWEGGLDYLGRADDQVKVGGHRIELAEVEAALFRLAGVAQAAVAHDGARLVGFVTTSAAEAPTPERLRAQLAQALPAWMVPARIRILPELILAASGKADRAALLALADDTHRRTPPRNPRETALSEIWARVLGCEVGVHDDFFRLGGDSIRGLQIVSRARRIGLSLPPDAVFRYPTVEQQALAADGVVVAATETPEGAWFALHPMQQRFLAQATEEPWHHAQSMLLRLPTAPDPAALERALAAVQRRHGMLRARFDRIADGPWQQRVDPAAPAPELARHDLRRQPDDALLALGTAVKRDIDLQHGPVWRAALIELTAGPVLLLVAHHLVIDHVSWGPLLDDLGRALRGEPLDPPPPSFAAWVVALRAAPPVAGSEPASQSARLPVDDPHGDLRAASAGRIDRIVQLLPPHATLREAELLSVVARSVGEWAGWPPGTTLAIDVEHHGRDARALGIMLDMSETVGWCTAIMPAMLAADADPAAAAAALAAFPAHGLEAMLAQDAASGAADIVMNHLGVVGGVGGGFERLALPTGPDCSPLRRAAYLIEFVCAQVGPALHCTWHFTARHHRASIQRLAAQFERNVLALSAPAPVLRRTLPPGALEAIARAHGPVEAVLPATSLQQGMLYHSALDPSGGAYIEQTVIHLAGALDPAAFRSAWAALTRRHAALRTLFAPDQDGNMAQVVLRVAEPNWNDEDWRGHPDPDTALDALLRADRAAGFDPSCAPPLRYRLLRCDDAHWRFVWTRHHALFDGWSLPPLLRDLASLADGHALPDAADPVAVSDAIAAREASASPTFWRDYLAGAEPTPTGAASAAAPPRASCSTERRLPAGPLLAFAREAGVTPATLLVACWGAVLAHEAGRDEAVFALTSSGRFAELPGAERAIGLFLTTLPVRVRLDRTAAPTTVLRRLQTELLRVRAHEHCPPAAMLPSEAGALATSLLTYENYPADPGLATMQPDRPQILAVETIEQSSFPLALAAGIGGDDMVLSLRFDPARFDRSAAAARLARVAQVLAQLDTAATIADALPPMDTSRFEAGPAIPAPSDASVHALILEQAARTPSAPAVLWDAEPISYAELVSRAGGVAASLHDAGVQPGEIVGLAAERCAALLPAVLGILLAGAAWCPLEPDQPAARREAMGADAGLRVALCGDGVDPPAGCLALRLEQAVATGAIGKSVPQDSLAYVIFTSGSTGRPKGVAVSHRAILNRLAWMQRLAPIGPGHVVLQKTPLGFDVSVWELLWPLLTGGTVALAPPRAHQDPEALAIATRRHGADVLHFVPSMLRAFLDAPGIERRCAPLRHVFTSGEALTPDLVAAWHARFACPLHNLYGPTEAAVDVTAWTCTPADAAAPVPIGRPVANVDARVLDPAMRRLPPGAVGELWLGGVQLASFYVRAPALTADAFRPDPYGPPGARLYRTGDRAAWREDGALLYHGRRDGQVKLRGVRIEIGEVEAALLAHPSVRDAAVRLDGDRLLAWVAPAVPDDLDAVLALRLPPAMRPSAVVGLARMHLTASGKLDRRALPVPKGAIAGALPRGALPRGALEVRIAALAAEVLGRRPGPDEELFALGLHSLAAVRLLNLIRRELGDAPPLAALQTATSVAGIAASLSGETLSPTPLVRLRTGPGTPLVLVHPVGGDVACFFRLAALLDRPVYALQSPALLGGSPARSIDAIADHYARVVQDALPGPIALSGYSMGCAIAFEMARRIGGRARSLLLIDGSARATADTLPDRDVSEAALAEARAAGLVPEGFQAEDAARLLAAAAAHQRCLAAWDPAPSAAEAVLIRTDPSAGSMGWDDLARGGLRILDLHAAHAAIVDEPHVAGLAALIETALAGATVPA